MTTIHEAIEQRHSIRSYTLDPIPQEVANDLNQMIAECNSEGNLNMQLVLNEPKAFGSKLYHYGMFTNVRNYLVLAGPKGDTLDMRLGYYGAKVMLRAKQLGLDSCWVGLTYRKVTDAYQLKAGDKIEAVIALGYGNGKPVNHRIRRPDEVADLSSDSPQWFVDGVKCALKAPTAVNQQKFHFALVDGKVRQRSRFGTYTQMDLGIVRYFFELGAGDHKVEWEQVFHHPIHPQKNFRPNTL